MSRHVDLSAIQIDGVELEDFGLLSVLSDYLLESFAYARRLGRFERHSIPSPVARRVHRRHDHKCIR